MLEREPTCKVVTGDAWREESNPRGLIAALPSRSDRRAALEVLRRAGGPVLYRARYSCLWRPWLQERKGKERKGKKE